MKRVIAFVLIVALPMTSFANSKVIQDSTHTVQTIIKKKSILEAEMDAEMFADEFELSFAGNISALTIGVATGIIGMALFAGLTQGEKVPPEIRIKNQSETVKQIDIGSSLITHTEIRPKRRRETSVF